MGHLETLLVEFGKCKTEIFIFYFLFIRNDFVLITKGKIQEEQKTAKAKATGNNHNYPTNRKRKKGTQGG